MEGVADRADPEFPQTAKTPPADGAELRDRSIEETGLVDATR
jgi:hypothetical protein